MFLRSLGAKGRPRASAYLVIIFFGLVLCALVTARLEQEQLIRTEGIRVTGTVQAFEELGGTSDYLLYSYEIGGLRYEVRELVSDRLRARLTVGDPLIVWLRPEQPDLPLLDDRGTAPLWVGLLIGVVFVLGGLFGLVQSRGWRRSRL